MNTKNGFEQFITGLPPYAVIFITLIACAIVVAGNQLPPNQHWVANLGYVVAPFGVYVWWMSPERSSRPLVVAVIIAFVFLAWWMSGGENKYVHKNDRDPHRHHH